MLDTPKLLDRLCQLTVEILDCDVSCTFLRQPQECVYVPVASFGFTPEQWEAIRVLKIPPAITTDLFERLERDEAVQMQHGDWMEQALSSVVSSRRDRAVLYVGLRQGSEVIGVLSASYHSSERRFTAQHERIARGLAQLASMALENARLAAELAGANRINADFVATMSHELRTPLNVIIGYSDILIAGDYGALTSEQIEPLRRVRKSALEQLSLITASLYLSRLDAAPVPVEAAEVSLRDLVEEIIDEIRIVSLKPGVKLVCNVPWQLRPIWTDRFKLKVAIKNLIDNALKFTDHGSVTVGARRHEGRVDIVVRDTGIGISPEGLSVIFEPFRQVNSSSTRRDGGAGLGLHIVQRLVYLLGGSIGVESEPDHGSTFQLSLPCGLAGVSRWGEDPRSAQAR
jgi:signal transduction histidine kinase